MLKVILENLVDDMNTMAQGIFTIEGPLIRKKNDKHTAKIAFYLSPITDEMKKVNKEDLKVIDLNYTFDLANSPDEHVFVSIAMSLLEAREKIKSMVMDMIMAHELFLSTDRTTKQQSDYVR